MNDGRRLGHQRHVRDRAGGDEAVEHKHERAHASVAPRHDGVGHAGGQRGQRARALNEQVERCVAGRAEEAVKSARNAEEKTRKKRGNG